MYYVFLLLNTFHNIVRFILVVPLQFFLNSEASSFLFIFNLILIYLNEGNHKICFDCMQDCDNYFLKYLYFISSSYFQV